MNESDVNGVTQTVDLGKYAERIAVQEDRPLFSDAVASARMGALRAAYIMIWLACAESLKRRFKEASLRDNKAGQVLGSIEQMEANDRAVDKYLLEEAKQYGFLTGRESQVLKKVYESRCIYAHPYEEAPLPEQVIAAAAEAVNSLLSKPVRLRHGYGQQILDDLLGNKVFLDDYEPKVADFARNIVVPRLDEGLVVWLVVRYWRELEKIASDPSMAVYFRRGVWFCRSFLEEVGTSIFGDNDWHDQTKQFPKTLVRVCGIPDLFTGIGELAQDSLVGSILEESQVDPSVLVMLETLGSAGTLSERQGQRFSKFISEAPRDGILKSGLTTKTCCARLISALQSQTFAIQNPAAELVKSNGPEQAADLSEEEQRTLGRHILDAAERGSWGALEFIQDLPSASVHWPIGLIRGIVFESFVSQENELRLRVHSWSYVCAVLVALEDDQRNSLITEVLDLVNVSNKEYLLSPSALSTIVESVAPYPWAERLLQCLNDLDVDG